MPEIPELEAIRAFCNEHLANADIADCEARIPAVFRTPMQEFRETLPADRLRRTWRQGKFLLFELGSGRMLAINPMLTGRFQYVDAEQRMPKKACLVLTFEHGRQLRYVDERLMGKLYLLPAESIESIPGWTDNGPDLFDPCLLEEWQPRLKPYRGRIKNVLINAAFVQGIGNAYADEILWEAGVNPYAKRTELDETQQQDLYNAALRVMDWATPLVAERMIDGDTLDYTERRDFLRVHRRGGEPCPRCGATISEITAGNRITSFCRTCQPGFVRP